LTLSEAPDFEPGSLFQGNYRIEGLLGSGGMSQVYKATHTVLQKPFAIKVIHTERTLQRNDEERFLNEAKTLFELSHENLVRISGFGMTASGKPYQILELVEGNTLAEWLARPNALSEEEKLQIAIQVCKGLAYAHSHGIVHRDLKPSNLIINKQGSRLTAKIIDFGIAKSTNTDNAGLTTTGAVVGSPAYMSPEQALGYKLDARSDIYSLGVVFFELFTGSLPFSGKTSMEVLTARLHSEPKLAALQSLKPHALANVIARCLQREPAARYGSVNELCTDLESLAAGRPIADFRLVSRTTNGNAIVAIGLAVAVMFGGFAFVWNMTQQHTGGNPVAPASGPATVGGGGSSAEDRDVYDLDQRAYVYFTKKQYDLALQMLRFGEKLKEDRAARDPRYEPFLAEKRLFIAECYVGQGQYELAEPYLEKAWSVLKHVNKSNYNVKNAADYYADTLRHLGKADKADAIQREYASL
jgi:tRNA A-37 threonylcarbamoyl transferase component Bud32/tetratricopeptide (TPR) repeat protein